MTFIVGGVLVIGGSHGLRSGLSDPYEVLVLRDDKYINWTSFGGSGTGRSSFKAKKRQRHLLLGGNNFYSYEYRYLITDALLWWASDDVLPVSSEHLQFIRSIGDVSELYSEAGPDSRLQEARAALESTPLAKHVSIFVSLTQGDKPLSLWAPRADCADSIIDNLRRLDVQFHLSLPAASREIPGMSEEIVSSENVVDGGELKLFGNA